MKNFYSIATNLVFQRLMRDDVLVMVPCSELVIVSVEPRYDVSINEQNEAVQVKGISTETTRVVCTSADVEAVIERLKMELEVLKQMEERWVR